MTGKITVGTIQDTDGNTLASTFVTSGSCKAWIGIDQIGTHSIFDSFNISSIADTGAGTNTTAYTNNFATNKWCATTAEHYAGNSVGASPYPGDPDVGAITTSAGGVQCYNLSGTPRDTAVVNQHVMGDLA